MQLCQPGLGLVGGITKIREILVLFVVATFLQIYGKSWINILIGSLKSFVKHWIT